MSTSLFNLLLFKNILHHFSFSLTFKVIHYFLTLHHMEFTKRSHKLWLRLDKIWKGPRGVVWNLKSVSVCSWMCNMLGWFWCVCAGFFLCACFGDALVGKIYCWWPNLEPAPCVFPQRLHHSAQARAHNHTHDLEKCFDFHHFVWSARPRAWQFKINISPHPLPSLLYMRGRNKVLLFVYSLHSPSWLTHMPHPALTALLPGPASWLAG